MEGWTLQQRIEIVKIHYKNGEKKSLWAMRPIFTLEAALISRIVAFGEDGSLRLIFLKIKLKRLFRWMDYAIKLLLMNLYGQNWKIWMWTMFISNKTVLRATQVAKPSVFCVKSFQDEWFLETAITIGCRDHANLAVEVISMTLFCIINGKPSTVKWNRNQMIYHKKHAFFL